MRARQDEDKDKKFLSFASILPDEDLKSDDSQADEGDSEEPHCILRVQLVRRTRCNLWQQGAWMKAKSMCSIATKVEYHKKGGK